MRTPTSIESRTASRAGFTLTELLVVIVILATLAALSFLGMRRIRETADKAASTRNLSQLQIANAAYAADHNGAYVPIFVNDDGGAVATRWFSDANFVENLIGVVKNSAGRQVTTIPLELLDPKVVRARNASYDKLYASYGMNSTGFLLRRDPGLTPRNHVTRIKQPGRSMAFSTATDYRVSYGSRFNYDPANDAKTSDGAMAYRHLGKALVVFYDGHVDEMSEGDIRELDESRGGNNSVFWKPQQ